MEQEQRNKSILYKYIPEQAVPTITEWIYQYDFKLRIKKSRTTKYGDYRPPHGGLNHQITINYDMNKYAFLITLVHEIAHLSNWNRHQNRVKPHGSEWKEEFKRLMKGFMHPGIFPEDVIIALRKYMLNPAASSCSDTNLLRTLKKHDLHKNAMLLEDLAEGSVFSYGSGRLFTKGVQIRKRFRCKEIKTGVIYLFDPLAEITLVESPLLPPRQIVWPFSKAST
jgi:hypothetical protein